MSHRTIESGATVKFHFTLTIDGEELESSAGCGPLEYTHGQARIVPGLEEGLEGLAAGDKKLVVVPPERAYGFENPKAIQEVPRSAFRDADDLSPGDQVGGQADGAPFRATIATLGEDVVVLDFNHPLAGKTLHYDVEIIEVG